MEQRVIISWSTLIHYEPAIYKIIVIIIASEPLYIEELIIY